MPRIPRDWELLALSRVTISRCDGPFGSAIKSEHYVDDGVRVVRLQNIGSAGYRDTDAAYLDRDYVEHEIGDGHWVLAGDILIAGLGDENNPLGRACVAPPSLGPTIVKADCYRFRLDGRRVDARFAALQLSALAHAECGFLATGSTRQRLNLGLASARYLALPPDVEEQRAIVKWIEQHTARIDALIEKKTRFIELLREKRQALITQAVTRGLDPSVPLKDSAVTWVGRVPSHWAVCKLSYRYKVELGKMLDEKRMSGLCATPYLRNQDVQWGSINANELPMIDIEPDERDRYTVHFGDLLVCEGGDVGRAAIWRGESGCVAYQKALHRLRPRDPRIDSSEFLELALRAAKSAGAFEEGDAKATISHLPAEKFRQYVFAFPPIEEQQAIVARIRMAAEGIEQLSAKAKTSIDLLRERRAALITAAVTGQIDIREAA